jgi:3-oxoacyl-[acyl-carrier protein] reductase
MRFEGKVGIVTGAGRGIGAGIARRLASEGSAVVVSDIDAESIPTVAESIQADGGRAAFLQVDVTQRPAIQRLVDFALQTFERIDLLVNNAGICASTAIEDISPEEWERMMRVNLDGVFFCSQAVMATMKEQRSGSILNMASLAGKVGGLAVGAHYAASKAGVICLTKSFAKALAPYRVRVNALAPGPVATTMTDLFTPEARAQLLQSCPLERFADVDDVAEAALFLLSDKAKHITGEILDVNGGLLMD